MNTRFEWDADKALSNVRKHGVTFEFARRAFADPFALVEQDRIEGGEYCWRTLGMIDGIVLLLVAHVTVFDDGGGELIRIVSARRAGRAEWRRYDSQDY